MCFLLGILVIELTAKLLLSNKLAWEVSSDILSIFLLSLFIFVWNTFR